MRVWHGVLQVISVDLMSLYHAVVQQHLFHALLATYCQIINKSLAACQISMLLTDLFC